MLTTTWSMKGGVGCSVVTALLAIRLARARPPILLVDTGRDLPVILGLPESESPTLADLVRLGVRLDAAAFDEVGQRVVPGLTLVSAGRLGDTSASAVTALRAGELECVIDGGCVADSGAPGMVFVGAAHSSLLVTRPCYLALRRSRELPARPTGVVVVTEHGRALTAADVEATVGAPVVASIAADIAIARAVDAGLLAGRVPRRVLDAFEGLA